jgi:hypothetical protein
MKRLLLISLLPALIAAAPMAQPRGGQVLWIKYDAQAKQAVLSNGEPLTNSLTPGYLVSYDRQGILRTRQQWRPPQDIIKTWPATNGTTRVNFSHERHFGALGNKDCKVCHAAEKGLGLSKPFPSLAKTPEMEPHSDISEGRFCANCHRSDLKTSELPGAKPSVDVAMFTALGVKGDRSCNSCHVPADHGIDFTRGHGERAGARQQCVACHRGATSASQPDLAQARSYQQAQIKLISNPEDKNAFQQTLPDIFCAYCHSLDQRPWRGEGGGMGRERD